MSPVFDLMPLFSIMRTFLLSLYFAVATVVAMAAPVSTPMGEFMISTGWTPANVDNALIARALSQAGFNTVLWPLDRLEVCRAAGLKLMGEQARPEDAAKLTADSAAAKLAGVKTPASGAATTTLTRRKSTCICRSEAET